MIKEGKYWGMGKLTGSQVILQGSWVMLLQRITSEREVRSIVLRSDMVIGYLFNQR
jgi:hypothetical protein